MVKIAEALIKNHFPNFGLCSVTMIKPLSSTDLLKIVGPAKSVIALEEHSIFGGLGSAICELLSEQSPRRVLRLGINDRFTDKCGTYEYLMQEHELDTESLVTKIRSSQL
jgi:transketolase